jgi:CheY-like chemotaxis protein
MKLDRKNLRILIVDDDETECELVQDVLLEAGFTQPLTRLGDGGIALEHLEKMKETGSLAPHIILLDLNMPGVDGVRALQRLRETPSFRDVPVIIVSGDDDKAKRREVAHLGIFRFLKKDSNGANVIAALDDFLGLYNHEASRTE